LDLVVGLEKKKKTLLLFGFIFGDPTYYLYILVQLVVVRS